MRITGRNRSLLLPLFDVNLVIGDLGRPDAAKQLKYQRYPACAVMRPGSIRSSISNGSRKPSGSIARIEPPPW